VRLGARMRFSEDRSGRRTVVGRGAQSQGSRSVLGEGVMLMPQASPGTPGTSTPGL
jgi:hypothetical protein